MRVAVIRPAVFGQPTSDAMMPLLFAILKPLTPAGIQIDFYDERARALPDSVEADLIALTVETFAARRAYQLADGFRAAGIPVVMGGYHPTMLPDEAKQHADAVLLGDAEDTWPQLLRDAQEGTLQPFYHSSAEYPLAGLRYDYGVFPKKHYPLVAMVQFGRGCKFACDFCSIHAFYGHSIRTRPLAEVVGDIAGLKQRYLFFTDDNLFCDETQATELFAALKPLKKKWVCQISMDVAKNPKLLRQMKESGCIMAVVGFESLSRENLRQMGKRANLAEEDYEEVIRNLHAAGIMIYGTFVIGYDADTAATAGELMDFALRHRFAIANFNPLMPMPGTPLYKRLEARGALPYGQWWLNEDYHYGDAMLAPAGMTEEELMESCKMARFRFNSPLAILRRATNFRANSRNPFNFLVFVAASVVSRTQIHFKQGRKLGAPKTSKSEEPPCASS